MIEFSPQGFSEEIFRKRYAFTDTETWQQACERLARQMSTAELPEKQKTYYDKFYYTLSRNLFVPGGRVWYGSGRISPNLLNCFVLNDKLDSKEGWGNIAKEMIITSMAQGGVGIDFSDIRPRDSKILGHGGTCPGPIEAMKLLDACAEPVKAGGGRRVAEMFSLDLDHPDINEFLDAKLVKGQLTHANVSVRCKQTSKFIQAVKDDSGWELSWKGKYKRTIQARDLWKKIVTNAYNSAEPGFLNWELVLNEANTAKFSPPVSTNPCGEHPLSPYDCCCLGHLVLIRFVNNGQIDWHLLAETIRTGVRFLDNILTVNHFPLPEMKETSGKLRRIGLGTTGLADMLVTLGLRYGSSQSIQFIDKLYRFIAKQAYEASIMLALEKGEYPLCDRLAVLNSGFMQRMPKKIRSLFQEYGMRNCTVLTVAPTGTVSILSDNCSSGIEPMFSPAYERRYWDQDQRKTELVFHPLFAKFMKEGKSVDHFVSSRELSVRQHMDVQKTVQQHIDQAVSKTINIPEDYPMEDVENLWLEYLPHLKGTTFYRENTRGYVDKEGKVHEPPLKAISLDDAKERFNENFKTEVMVNDCNSGVCEL